MAKNITKKELQEMYEKLKEQYDSEKKIMEEKIRELETKNKEYWDRILRMQADFENFQKNMERERENFARIASEKIILDLVEDLENMEMLLNDLKNKNSDIYNSFKLVYDHFLSTLEKNGLKTIESVGKKFDPYYHEAIMIEETVNNEDGIVVEEFKKGYTLNGKVIRPSKVKVLRKR